jgi:hypothetical protein
MSGREPLRFSPIVRLQTINHRRTIARLNHRRGMIVPRRSRIIGRSSLSQSNLSRATGPSRIGHSPILRRQPAIVQQNHRRGMIAPPRLSPIVGPNRLNPSRATDRSPIARSPIRRRTIIRRNHRRGMIVNPRLGRSRTIGRNRSSTLRLKRIRQHLSSTRRRLKTRKSRTRNHTRSRGISPPYATEEASDFRTLFLEPAFDQTDEAKHC